MATERPHFELMSSITESENELSKILDSNKLSDIQHSDRLRDFYKKLVQTDAAIRNLRKSFNDNTPTYSGSNYDFNSINNNYDINSKVDIDTDLAFDRLKRSINFHPSRFFNFKTRDPTTQSKINNGKLITKSTINMTSTKKANHKHSKSSRNKRFGNFSGEGFTIEENKVMIQYKPSRLVPKCSHAPKDSKSHEKQLAHPFYKNTQKLDELLNQFIDKKLPDLLVDRLELGTLYGENKNKKYKNPDTEEVIIIKDDELLKDYEQNERLEDNQKDTEGKYFVDQRSNDNPNDNEEVKIGKDSDKVEPTTVRAFVVKEAPKIASKDLKHSANVFENEFFEDSDGVERKKTRSSTNGYDILLSISTLANPGAKRSTSESTTVDTNRPNLRKLLQANVKAEDDDAYENFKEVMVDYKEGHNDGNKENDRKNRNEIVQNDHQAKEDELKYVPMDVHNPNWKGPLPLYPDEITQMTIKGHSPDNKVEIPVHSQDLAPETDDAEPIRTDVEYVEDYLDNGYERLVELAQAYSDYGVLNKKDTTSDKTIAEKEHKLDSRRVEKPMKKFESIKRGLKRRRLFKKLKKARDVSEGIRIEFQPSSKQAERDDSTSDVISKFREIFDKHIKISGPNILGQDISSVFCEKPHLTVNNLTLPMNPNKFNANTDKHLDLNNNNVIIKKRTLKADFVTVNNVTDTLDENINEDDKEVKEFNQEKINFDVTTETKSRDANSNTKGNYKMAVIPIKIDETTLNINSKIDMLKMLTTSKTKSGESIENRTKESSRNESESSLSSFFALLSKWFSALDEMEVGAKNLSNVLSSDTNAKVKGHNKSGSSEYQLAYPVYDSDMIENIGHRSRVLLSIEVTNNTKKAEEYKSDDRNELAKAATSTEPMNKLNSTQSARKTTESIKNKDDASNETNNRLVKRQAIDDSNLIFWNDLYDDEYGVNADSLENNIRDKHSAEKSPVKKPNSWIQDKMKKLSDRFYNSSRKATTKMVKDKSKHVKRNIKYDLDGDDDSGKLDLSELTKRMKKVCKETVRAVQETKHVEVRNDKENTDTSSLMQQLVRLMTDLLDFQVQERTCRKLPLDLQNFLEWLTSSNVDDTDVGTYYKDKNDMEHLGLDFAAQLDKPTDQDLLQPSEREDTDSKTDCLGTLQAVQNLIREYEEMTEDDKSVMMGVKNYLENQMHFLQKQLSYIEDNKYLNQGSRFKRDLISDVGHTVAGTIDETAQQLEKQYKYLKKKYQKYKAKIRPAYEGILKATSQLNRAVTDMAHKMFSSKGKNGKEFKFGTKIFQNSNNRKSLKKLDKFNNIENVGQIDKTEKIGKINKLDKIVKIKEQLKTEKNLKDKKIKRRNKPINFFNKNKMATDNVGFNDYFNYDINVGNIDFEKNGPSFIKKDQDSRSIKDVYFKAVEEAKKLSLSKGGHKRDSDMFDKTDIFRINEYVGEKQK